MALVVSVGAGEHQEPLIRHLAAQGHTVAAFARDPGPGFAHAAIARVGLSTWDAAGAIAWIDQEVGRPDAVGCFSYGKAVETALRIAHHFGLPGAIAPERAAAMHDKQGQRALLRGAGLRVPGAPAAGGRAVVKPRGASGSSRGVRVLPTAEALALPDHDCEDFIPGDEHRIAGWFHHGETLWTGALRRWNRPDSCLAARYQALAATPDWASDVVRRIADAAGLATGLVKADVVLSPAGPVVIEADLGICGDHLETALAPGAWGLDLVAAYAELILDRRPRLDPSPGRATRLEYRYGDDAAPGDGDRVVWRRAGPAPVPPQSQLDAACAVLLAERTMP